MSLSLIISALPNSGSTSNTAWASTETKRGEKVAQYREYADGDHPNNLNAAQRHLLNLSNRTTDDSHPFNENLCPVIIDTMLDRIHVTDIKASSESEGATEAQDKWIKAFLRRNRFDSLQLDVTEATVRDGNSYLLSYPDEETGEAKWAHEPAYDGNFGTVVRYATTSSKDPLYAIKVWKTTSVNVADTTRINIYYPNRIARFVTGETIGSLVPFTADGEPAVISWVDSAGEPLGVPFSHFRNRGGSVDNFGLSELENVIPLQDGHNTTLVSAVATALLQAFPIRGLVGDDAPAAVTPGLILSFYAKDASGRPTLPSPELTEWLKSIQFLQFDGAEITPFIELLTFLKNEMFAVTNTPTDDVAADASGEARKQSEVKLIGKVKRFCVRNGNAWEDAVRMAARIEARFTGNAVPVFEELSAEYADPEVRNDSKTIADVQALYRDGIIPLPEARRQLQGIFGWTDDDILQMEADDEKARNQQMEDQANAEDAAMVEGVLGSLKKKRVGEVVIGGGNVEKPAA